MKAAVIKWVDSATRSGLLIGLVCWVLFMGVTHGVPASWWLEVASVHIPDASAGQPVRMAVQRTIRRDFVAEWSASVRTDDGAAQVVCVGSGKSNYRQGANLPANLTLDWWTDGACKTLRPGRYWVATDWDIRPAGIWPAKRVSSSSNRFEVRP